MSKEAMKLALEALEQIARLTGPRWALENSYAGHLEAITALREALANEALDKMADNARELGLDYEPDTPFGDSNPGLQWDEVPQAFNDWWNAEYDPTGNPFKQNSYAYWAWAGWEAAKQPAQQEPVAWMHPDGRIWTFGRGLDKSTFTIPLYTSPPAQRKPLTDEEIDELSRTMVKGDKSVNWLCRAIEAAHGIKENT